MLMQSVQADNQRSWPGQAHLELAGVPFRRAVQLMRHSDPKLTARVYTDPALLDLEAEVAKLDSNEQRPQEIHKTTPKKRSPMSANETPQPAQSRKLKIA